MLYSVMFNLNDDDTDYKGLHEALFEYGHSKRILDAMWIIASDDDAVDIFADLRQFFSEDGDLFVAELCGDNYEFWLEKNMKKWTDRMYKRMAR